MLLIGALAPVNTLTAFISCGRSNIAMSQPIWQLKLSWLAWRVSRNILKISIYHEKKNFRHWVITTRNTHSTDELLVRFFGNEFKALLEQSTVELVKHTHCGWHVSFEFDDASIHPKFKSVNKQITSREKVAEISRLKYDTTAIKLEITSVSSYSSICNIYVFSIKTLIYAWRLFTCQQLLTSRPQQVIDRSSPEIARRKEGIEEGLKTNLYYSLKFHVGGAGSFWIS